MSKVIIDGVEYVPKGEEVKEWPKWGDEYWFVDEYGELTESSWAGDRIDESRMKVYNVFPTKQKAEYERLRRECMATRWVPEDDEEFFCYNFMDEKIMDCRYGKDGYLSEVLLGLARPTEEEAKARWDMYGDAWLDALEAKK